MHREYAALRTEVTVDVLKPVPYVFTMQAKRASLFDFLKQKRASMFEGKRASMFDFLNLKQKGINV
jgi:hypothetical protein